jgi:hypothetical protein
MTVEELVPDVRSALGVSSSYEDVKIPSLIRRTINRLLRDYHFPKSVRRQDYLGAAEGDFQFALPVGFKQELEIRYFDPTDSSYSDPLTKRERFQLPYPSGNPHFYWLEGTNLLVDTPYNGDMVGFSTFLWYESMDSASNEGWFTTDFPDAAFYFSVVRGCAEFRKPEVMQIYGPLWSDEQQSLAIYTEELRWNNAEIRMREPAGYPPCRYPRG